MTGSVAVVVPRTPGSCEHRDTNWAWLKARWGSLHPTWSVVEGTADPAAWCKAEAVADALTRTDADTLVICDADLLCDPAALNRAVVAVDIGAAWAVPYHSVRRLTPAATAAVVAQHPTGPVTVPDTKADLTRHPYSSRPGGGVLVVPRGTYLDVGGFDPRFVGWGGEDVSLGLALRTLAGEFTRVRGDLIHLWHPAQPTRRDGGRGPNGERERRYRRAKDDPAGMRALIEENSQ